MVQADARYIDAVERISAFWTVVADRAMLDSVGRIVCSFTTTSFINGRTGTTV